MNPIDERLLCFVAGVVIGWLLQWLWTRSSRARATPAPRTAPTPIVTPPPAEAPGEEYAAAPPPEPASSRLIDVGAARAAGFNLKHADDLTIIEGIGPRTDDLLRAYGIGSFAQLARLHGAELEDILERGGPAFRLAKPASWAEQARLAAENRWPELKRLQQEMIGGAAGGNT